MSAESVDLWLRVLYTVGLIVTAIVAYGFMSGRFVQRGESADLLLANKIEALESAVVQLDRAVKDEHNARRVVDIERQSSIGRLQVDAAGTHAQVAGCVEGLRELRAKVFNGMSRG